jgi:hypothetical protein
MTDWKGVVDADNNPIEFSRDNLRMVCRIAGGVAVLRGIQIAIAEIDTGARQKN